MGARPFGYKVASRAQPYSGEVFMDDIILANIRSRIKRCRWLAAHTTDDAVAEALQNMANEGDADLERLLRQPNVEITPWTVQ